MVFNPGTLNEKVTMLALTKNRHNYRYTKNVTIHAQIQYMDKLNIFSKVGIGVKSIKFITRKRNITLHNAFNWKGQHYFLTDVREIDRTYYEVTAAQIEPKKCYMINSYERYDNLNRPVHYERTAYSFPGFMTEKYLGYQQQIPHVENDYLYVLVTPKVILFNTGDKIKIDNNFYNVRVVHGLDEFKNEYEIGITKDG